MQIAMISPSYPESDCGISTYTGYLTRELKRFVEVDIIRQNDASADDLIAHIVEASSKADVIHIQHAVDLYGYLGWRTFKLYRALEGRRVVTTIHELPDAHARTSKERLVSYYFKQMMRAIARYSDVIVVHSDVDARLLARWGIVDNVVVIPHGTIHDVETVATSYRKTSEPVIGFFGFITENKGIHRVLDALPYLPEVRFVVAGQPKTLIDRDYLERLQQQVTELGLENRVEFHGFLPDSAMYSFFSSVDILVFPYARCTASGALHIALGHGAVVLTSDIGFFQEIGTKYDCLETFPLEDPATLAEKIEYLLDHPERREQLADGARRFINITGWSNIALETVDLYKSLVAGKPVSVYTHSNSAAAQLRGVRS
jgi:glycosyltransferase involved in cell wall biosynthesis